MAALAFLREPEFERRAAARATLGIMVLGPLRGQRLAAPGPFGARLLAGLAWGRGGGRGTRLWHRGRLARSLAGQRAAEPRQRPALEWTIRRRWARRIRRTLLNPFRQLDRHRVQPAQQLKPPRPVQRLEKRPVHSGKIKWSFGRHRANKPQPQLQRQRNQNNRFNSPHRSAQNGHVNGYRSRSCKYCKRRSPTANENHMED